MSLRIDTGKVKAVLLSDGEWYQCKSFELESYGFMDAAHVEPELGFRMQATLGSSLTVTRIISGPLSSIQALEQEI
jgi:hypothetical protein